MKRLTWIDIAKTIAIFLVALLHTHCDDNVGKLINGMVMPLFFIISGYLFSYRNNPDYRQFLRKRARQLLVPYLWINVLAYIVWVFVLRYYGVNVSAEGVTPWYVPLVGIFGGVPALIQSDVPMWAILCFFVVEAIYYPCGRTPVGRFAIALAGLVLSWAIDAFIPTHGFYLPFTLGPACAGIFFYAIGYELRQIESKLYWLYTWPVALVCLAIYPFAVFYNYVVEFYIVVFSVFPLYLLSSFTGSLFVIILSRKLGMLGSNRLIRFISRVTLLICGFHMLAFAVIRGITYFGFHIPMQELADGIWRGLAMAICGVAISLIGAWIVERYARPLVDK